MARETKRRSREPSKVRTLKTFARKKTRTKRTTQKKAVDVLTNRYNSARTGANVREDVLNQTNVNVNTFGKIFSRTVNGQIYAQPLIVSDLSMPGMGRRQIVFIATTRNMVYAFDAEHSEICNPFWAMPLDEIDETPVPRGDYGSGYGDFSSEIGITSTPVIDRDSETIYLTSKSKKVDAAGKRHYRYRLHALDLKSGAEKFGGPHVIAEVIVNGPPDGDDFTFLPGCPSVPGRGAGSVDGKITFNAFLQLQRPGLLLQDGAIFAGFGSHGDIGDYHGWILAFDAATLKLLASYCTTPNFGEGGVWQSGCGLAGDGDGNIFAVCGNGRGWSFYDPATGPYFGQSVLKLRLDRRTGQLMLVDWFTPKDIGYDNIGDVDLCAGPVLLPWRKLVGAWGKDSAYYIMDQDQLGKFRWDCNAIAQYAPDMTSDLNIPWRWTRHIHCAPVMFDDPTVGPVSYVWGENDRLRGYRFNVHTGQFETVSPPFLLSDNVLPPGMPGGMLTASCKGSARGTAILWALHPTAGDAVHATVAGTLQAYKADDLTQVIWSSNHDPRGTDDLGYFAKFCPPVVANGRVYVATFSQELVVYGLLSERLGSPLGKWQQADIPAKVAGGPFQVEGTASTSCGRFTILGAGSDIWDKTDAFHYVYQPVVHDCVEISARVVRIKNTNPWAKAGVMIRSSADEHAAYGMVILTPPQTDGTSNGANFQYRSSKGAETFHLPFTRSVNPPHWVRVVRIRRSDLLYEFSGFISINGTDWERIGGPVNIEMTPNALAGMAVTSHVHAHPLQDLCFALIDMVDVRESDAS